MRKEELNTDKAFREKMENYSVEPPVHVWDGVQGEMAALRRKKRIAFFSRIAAAAVILLAFLAGWYFNDRTNEIIPESVQNETTPDKQQNRNESETNNPQNEGIAVASSKEEKTGYNNEEQVSTAVATKLVADNSPREEIVLENRREQVKTERSSVPSKINAINKLTLKPKTKAELSRSGLKRIRHFVSDIDRDLIAQNTLQLENKKDVEGGWKLGVNVSPGYSSQASSHSGEYSRNMTYQTSEGNANIGGGISVQYKTNKRWSIESGVYYAQNGQKSGNSQNVFALSGDRQSDQLESSVADKFYFNTAVNVANNQMAMNSTAGIIEFDEVPKGAVLAANPEENAAFSNALMTNGEFSQVFEFVEIPLYVRYLLLDSKIDVEFIGGLNAGLVVGNNAFMDNEFGLQNVGKTKDISPVNVSGTLGVGVNYALGRRLSLAFEPRLNYFLNSINTNPAVDYRPYRIGVYTGLYYEF